MGPLLNWILQHRIAVVLIVTALTVFFGFEARKIEINTDFVTYLSEESEVVQEFRRAGEVFESNYMAMVVFAPSNGQPLFSRDNLTILSELTARYDTIEGVTSVLSIANAPDVKETPYGISIEDLVGTEIPDGRPELDDLRSYVAAKELYRGVLLDDEGESALLLLTFEASADHMVLAEHVISQTAAANGSTEGFYFGGMPFVMYSMSQGILANLSLLVPLILLFLIAVLCFAFRSLSGVIFPLLVVAVSAVWAVGILSLLDVPLDILTAIMPVILIAMGSADGIHLMKKYSEERRGGRRATEAMRESVTALGVPILLTSLTTMVGFAALVVSDFRIIKTFGLAVTLAIFLALAVTLIFLPALAALFSRKTGETPDKRGDSPAERLMDRLSSFIHRKKRNILISFGALTILAVAGIPLITVNVDWSLCLAKNSKPYAAEMMLRDRFGGSLPLQVSVKGDVQDPAILQAIQDIQEQADSQPVIENARSVVNLIAEMNYVLNGTYAVPDTPEGVANLWLLIEGEESLNQFVGPMDREALIQGRVSSMATADIRASTQSMSRYLDDAPSALYVIDKTLLTREAGQVVTLLQAETAAARLSRLLGLKEGEQRELSRRLRQTSVRPDQEAQTRAIESQVASYLASDLSEIPMSREEKARSIAAEVAILVAETPSGALPTPEDLATGLAPLLPEADEVDRLWLADSLLFEIERAVRRAKNDGLLLQLRPAIGEGPLPSPTEKHVRGVVHESTGEVAAISSSDYAENKSLLAAGLIREVPLEAALTGMVPVLTEMENRLLPTQIQSVAITLGVVLLVLVLVFRSLKLGLVALAPTLLTVLTNFAILGYAGIGLDSFTALIASAVIGLGIDYAIHLVTKYRRELARIGESAEALRITLRTTGIAILINAVSVGIGFEILNFAAGQHIRIFGGLLGFSLLASAVYTLILLPALLIAIGDQPDNRSQRHVSKKGATV